MRKLLTFVVALGAIVFPALASAQTAQIRAAVLNYRPPAVQIAVSVLTTGSSWTVPSNFVGLISVECISGGGGSDGNGAPGAGAYAKITSTSTVLTPGVTSISVGIGAGGAVTPAAGGDTWWNATSLANAVSNGSGQSVACQGCQPNSGATPGAGGAAASSVGTTSFSGGAGGVASTDTGGGAERAARLALAVVAVLEGLADQEAGAEAAAERTVEQASPLVVSAATITSAPEAAHQTAHRERTEAAVQALAAALAVMAAMVRSGPPRC
jgi:hypothetical protein